jgi:hypothetical protein
MGYAKDLAEAAARSLTTQATENQGNAIGMKRPRPLYPFSFGDDEVPNSTFISSREALPVPFVS